MARSRAIDRSVPAAVCDRVPPDLAERLVALRHALHQHPELAFEERQTSARLRQELERLRPAAIESVADTGLVARFPGRRSDVPAVAIRGDIDALPIEEETGAAFRSTVPGRMHACGHDVHAAWTVGAAALLAAKPAAGDVVVVLQPAEEVGLGAGRILDAGALDGVAAIFGAHVDLRFVLGEVVTQAGPLAASTDDFVIDLAGGGSHGARPQESRDPIVGGAAVVAALQTIVSRRVTPGDPAVVSVGSFHAGQASNVIPAHARLTGTFRATKPETRSLLADEISRLVYGVGEAYGLEVAVRFEQGTPPLVNTPREAGWARRAAEQVLGAAALRPLGAVNMGGEDFALYLERLPGCFLRIGGRRPADPVVGAHSPRFLPADETVLVGAVVLAEVARTASAELATPEDGQETGP